MHDPHTWHGIARVHPQSHTLGCCLSHEVEDKPGDPYDSNNRRIVRMAGRHCQMVSLLLYNLGIDLLFKLQSATLSTSTPITLLLGRVIDVTTTTFGGVSDCFAHDVCR